MAGYRFNLKNWLAVEADYDYFRNHETFLSSSQRTSIPMNVHAATGTAIVKRPSFKLPGVNRVFPLVLGGGGAMFFAPRPGSLSEQMANAKIDNYTHAAVPSLGMVFTF